MGAGLPTLLQSAWAVTSLSRGGAALDVLKVIVKEIYKTCFLKKG
jgi:hypothetical protein